MKRLILIALLGALTLTGCDSNESTFENSARSGSIANDFVEQPLTKKAQKFEQALKTSNEFLDLWVKKDFQTIHDTLIDPDLRNEDKTEILSVEKLASIHENVEKTYGKIVGYKEMQWAFESKSKKRQYFLFNIKIVEHERQQLDYLFQFLLDGGFKKLIGVYVRPKATFRAPGQIHNGQR